MSGAAVDRVSYARQLTPATYEVVHDGVAFRAAIRPLPSSEGALALAFGVWGPGQQVEGAGELVGLIGQHMVGRAALASLGLVAAGFPVRQALVGGLAVSAVIEAFAVGFFVWQKAELLAEVRERNNNPGEATGPTVEAQP